MLAHILAELKLLTTNLGHMAMSVAAVNDVTVWILLALSIVLLGSGSPFVSVYILLYDVGFIMAATFLMRPVLVYMARLSPAGEPVKPTVEDRTKPIDNRTGQLKLRVVDED